MREIVTAYQGFNLECDNALFTDFLDKWLKSIEGIIKLSKWETYDKTAGGKIKPYFEPKHYRFRDMKPEIFTEYFVYLSQHGKSNGKGGLSYKTVKNIRGVLSSAYEYALVNRYVNENPVLRSRMPSFPNSIKKDVPEYNAQQVRKLLLYAKEHESHIYIFLLLALYSELDLAGAEGLEQMPVHLTARLPPRRSLKTVRRTVFLTLTPSRVQVLYLMKNKKIPKHISASELDLAGAEGLEPSARGFGDRCSTN